MATIDFPTSPIVGQQYTFGIRTWVWDGYGWEKLINGGQSVSFLSVFFDVVDTYTLLPYTVPFTPFTYV